MIIESIEDLKGKFFTVANFNKNKTFTGLETYKIIDVNRDNYRYLATRVYPKNDNSIHFIEGDIDRRAYFENSEESQKYCKDIVKKREEKEQQEIKEKQAASNKFDLQEVLKELKVPE